MTLLYVRASVQKRHQGFFTEATTSEATTEARPGFLNRSALQKSRQGFPVLTPKWYHSFPTEDVSRVLYENVAKASPLSESICRYTVMVVLYVRALREAPQRFLYGSWVLYRSTTRASQ